MAHKPMISEMSIAGQFVLQILQGIQTSWPGVRKNLSDALRKDAAVLDDRIAPFEFGLAVIAMQIQALPNLLPPDQAERIRAHVIRCLCSDDLGTYPSDAIDEYQAAWDKSLEIPEPPYFGIASVLYDKLGCSETSSIGDATFKSPTILIALGSEVATFGGPFWKTAVSEYTIVS